jgi:hypothetical protein
MDAVYRSLLQQNKLPEDYEARPLKQEVPELGRRGCCPTAAFAREYSVYCIENSAGVWQFAFARPCPILAASKIAYLTSVLKLLRQHRVS